MSEQETFEAPGYTLQTRTECQIGSVDDEWHTWELDCGDELDEAIEAAREDHDEEFVIETDSIWFLKVSWNENTDSVWVGRYGYNGGMEVES